MKQHVESARNHGIQKRELVCVVVVKRGAIDSGQVGDVLYRDVVEALILHERLQGALKELPRSPDSWITYFTVGNRHNS